MERRFCITLVRHGETIANRDNVMQGQKDTQLSDLGKKQAQLVAQRFQNEKITHLYSSDLKRAADTATAITEANASCCGVVLDKRLRERGFGVLEGKPLAEYRKALDAASVPAVLFTPKGGETMEQVESRATGFFNELCARMAEPLISQSTIPSRCQSAGTPRGSRQRSKETDTSGGCSQECSTPSCTKENCQTKDSSDIQKPLRVEVGGCLGHSPPTTPTCAVCPQPASAKQSSQEVIAPANGAHSELEGGEFSNLPDKMANFSLSGSCGSDRGACSLTSVADEPPSCQSLSGVFEPPLFATSCAMKHGSSVDVEPPNVVIVSHGLLLRCLKRLILCSYPGRLEGNNALEAGRISPNTGVSRFTLSVCYHNQVVSARCVEIITMNNTSHLADSEDLVTHAKFQGAF